MILPTKYLPAERTMVVLGARILELLDRPRPISWVWDRLSKADEGRAAFTYDWFVLSVDFLFVLGAVEFSRGELRRA